MGQEEVIAGRYARGLAEYAKEAGEMEAVRESMRILSGLLDPRSEALHVPDLQKYLASPTVPVEEKLRIAGDILNKAGICAAVNNFLGILIRKGRVELLPRIYWMFSREAGEMTGEYVAVVHTARPLSADQASRLAKALSSAFGGTVRLHQRVEPGLLAGARVVIGDKTFDGSVLGRLERLKHRLVSCGAKDLKEMAAAETAAGS